MAMSDAVPSAAMSNDGFAPEAILPVQFFAPPTVDLPEMRLMLAVLEDAVLILHRHVGERGARAQRLVREVEQWVDGHNREWLFSFENICAALNLNPSAIRRGLRGLLGATGVAAPVPLSLGIARRVAGERHRVSAPRRHRRTNLLSAAETPAETA